MPHLQEALLLIKRIIQLSEGVADLHATDVALKALDRGWIVQFRLGQG